jgi:hypothetical protein
MIDLDECRTMIGDCMARESKLTDWERQFIDSIESWIDKGQMISLKQNFLLEEIWERVTAPGLSNPYRCECGWIGTETSMLSAPHPFDPDAKVLGCPNCSQIGEFTELCDEPGCITHASCGSHVAGVYRRTCYQHSGFNKGPK